MPFQVSPGVNVSEIDLTTVVPAVSSTEGAIAGVFRWGPVNERVLVDSELALVNRFGRPTTLNAETFFTAANFLAYGNKLYVVRAANTTSTDVSILARNAVANVAAITSFANGEVNAPALVIKNEAHYDEVGASAALVDTDVLYAARYPGLLGNSLKISVCDSTDAYSSATTLTGGDANIESSTARTFVSGEIGNNTVRVYVAPSSTGTVGEANTRATSLISLLSVGDYIELGNTTIGKQKMKVVAFDADATTDTSNGSNTFAFFDITTDSPYNLSQEIANDTLTRYWEYHNVVDAAPGTSIYQAANGNSAIKDELHVVVADEDGQITGAPGTILEVYAAVSRVVESKTPEGASNYFKNVINQNSRYAWYLNDRSGAASGTIASIATSSNAKPLTLSFQGGLDGKDESTIALAALLPAYDLYRSAEEIDISLVLQGKARGSQLANYLIDNLAEVRKDCVVFISPEKEDVVYNEGSESTDVVAFRNELRSTSYAVLDSGYKYQYDKYNDLYRWVPLNGDTAGLCVRTDDVRDPWFSPAGFNRGQIKNIVKLAYNPQKAARDILYKAGVNPVVTFPGQGTVLFGDKTLLAKPSAFDRINVRRLFIVLEKAIATAAKFTLFEFNDDFTRAQFRNLVEPFLRDVQGRRGIYDFKVVCDGTNNTGEVIDRNEFVGDIYIKPAKSINFIQLNFVAVRTGVEFSEVVGQA
jgi:phage tail sheath protein FI